MSIKSRLEKEEQEANKLQEAFIAGKTEEEASASAPAPESPEETPQPQPAAVKPEEPQKPDVTPGPEPEQPAAQDFEHKYRVLQGKYSAEVPRLNNELKETRGIVATQQSQILELTQKMNDLLQAGIRHDAPPAPARDTSPAAPAASQPSPAQPAEPDGEQDNQKLLAKYFTPQEILEFGEDLLLIQAKAIEKKVSEEVSKRKQLEQRLDTIERKQREPDEKGYLAALAEKIPDLNERNADPGFLSWLAQPDPVSGIKRHDLLLDAHKKLDVERVARIFNLHKDESGITPPAQPPMPDIDAMVEPGQPMHQAPSTTKNKGKVYKMKDWDARLEKLTEDKIHKRISDDDYKTQEAELMSAYRQGRVV
jgi:uncharacterized coiled-coil protein SlyX